MKDWIDIVKQFGFPITPWVLLGILLLSIFRDRLTKGRADLITAIANCGTREAARLLLYLRDSVPDQRPNILNGLVLIGGVAVEEALLSCRRNELSEAALKVLFNKI